MIQRLQTLYLLIVFILCIVSLCSTIAGFNAGGEEVACFGNFGFHSFSEPFTNIDTSGPWALGVLLIVIALLSLYTIIMFHKRVLQMRLTVFNIVLLVGYILLYALYVWIYQQKLGEVESSLEVGFQMKLTAIYPLVSIILCILAFRGIRKDEKLVRSLERIR